MLKFLRKQQRAILFVTGVALVGTFFASGAMGSRNEKSPEDPVAFDLAGGRAIKRSQLKLMAYLLSAGDGTTRDSYGSALIGSVNGNFVYKELFESGLIEKIANKALPTISENMGQQIEKMAAFKGYTHPQADFLSSRVLWERVIPESAPLRAKIASAAPIDQQFFKEILTVYKKQQAINPAFMRQLMLYQQSQVQGISRDPAIEQSDLSVFGAHTLHDWFGSAFLESLSKVVMQGAHEAKKSGYKVSRDEVWGDLIQNMRDSLQRERGGQAVSATEAAETLVERLEMLQLPRKEAIDLWEHALLFKRFFGDVSAVCLDDSSAMRSFALFAGGAGVIDEYRLPELLQPTSFSKLMELEIYFESLYGQKRALLELPRVPLPLSKIKTPELLKRSFEVVLKEIDLRQVERQITLKQMWEWQLDPAHFAALAERFPLLAGAEAKTRSARDQLLDEVPPYMRAEIDNFTREQMVLTHPEWVSQQFGLAEERKLSCSMRNGKVFFPVEGGDPGEELLTEMVQNRKVGERAEFKGRDGKLFSLQITSIDECEMALSLEEALAAGVLEEMVDEKLEKSYPAIRARAGAKFKDSEGEWKPLDEVRDEVGELCFKEVTGLILADYLAQGGKKEWQGAPSPAFYAHHRFDAHLRHLREALIAGDTESLQRDIPEFQLVAARKEISRAQAVPEERTRLFAMQEGEWSHPIEGNRFFHLLSYKTAESAPLPKLSNATKGEIKAQMMDDLLGKTSL